MVSGDTSAQLRRGIIGPCILVLLSSGAKFGLQIVRELDSSGGLLSSQGTVYPLLNRLSDAGLVTSYWEVAEAERPRRYYELTDAGRTEAEHFRDDWAAFSASVSRLMEGLDSDMTGESR